MAIDPTNPATPQPVQPTDTAANIANLSSELNRQRSIQQEINQIFKDSGDNMEAAINKSRQYVDSLIDQAKTVNETKKANKELFTEYDLAKANLQSQIELNNTYSDILKNKLQETIRSLTDDIRELNSLKEEEKKLIDELGDKYKTQDEIITNYIKAQKELQEAEEKVRNSTTKSLAVSKQEKEELEQKRKNLRLLAIDYSAIIELEKIQTQISEKQASVKKSETASKAIADNVKANEAQEILNKNNKEAGEIGEKLGNKLFGAADKANIFTSSLVALSRAGEGFAKQFGMGLVNSLIAPELAMNRFFNFLNKNLIQSTFEFDKILSEVNKNTGGFRDEFEKIAFNKAGPFSASAISSLATYGIGIKELGASYTALSNKINGFNRMSEEQRLLLSKNAATMENLGLSAQVYAEMTSKLMASIGKTADGAKETINALAKDAIAAGRSVGEYTKEFEQLMPQLQAYGKEATQLFKELNSLAGMTKGVMSTGDLMKFSEQFANWDSAAEAVSKLNAALGGTSLNIQDLMTADPTDRLMQIKRAFDESGQDFDKLNAGYKKLLAESFGGDIAKAASFFKGSLAEANAEMNKMAATEKELEERKKKSVAATEKLAKAIDTMKIAFTPLIDMVALFAEGVAKISDTFGGFGTFLMVGLPLGFIAVSGMLTMLGRTIGTTFTGIFTGIGARLTALIGQLRVANTAAATLSATSATASAAAAPAAAGGLGTGALTAGGAADGGLLMKGRSWLGKGAGAIKNIGKFVLGSRGRLLTAGATIAATSLFSNKAQEHEDGEKTLGPGKRKVLSEMGEDGLLVPTDVSAPGDTAQVRFVKDPDRLSKNESFNIQPIIAMNRVADNFTKVMETNKNYAQQLTIASKAAKVSNSESTREMFSKLSESIKTQNNRPIVLNKVIAKIDADDREQIYNTAAEMGAQKANSASYSKV